MHTNIIHYIDIMCIYIYIYIYIHIKNLSLPLLVAKDLVRILVLRFRLAKACSLSLASWLLVVRAGKTLQHLSKCNKVYALKKHHMAKSEDLRSLCENPVCPDPVWTTRVSLLITIVLNNNINICMYVYIYIYMYTHMYIYIYILFIYVFLSRRWPPNCSSGSCRRRAASPGKHSPRPRRNLVG